MLVSNCVAEGSKRSNQSIVNDVKKLSLAVTTCSHRSQNSHGRLTLPGLAIPGAVIIISVCTRKAALCNRGVCSGAAQCKPEYLAVLPARHPAGRHAGARHENGQSPSCLFENPMMSLFRWWRHFWDLFWSRNSGPFLVVEMRRKFDHNCCAVQAGTFHCALSRLLRNHCTARHGVSVVSLHHRQCHGKDRREGRRE